MGVIIIIINIGIANSNCESKEPPKNNWPHRNTIMANGNVSSSGALDEISPSLFSPLRRLKKEPVLSPKRQAKPRNVPRMKAEIVVEPISNQESSKPVNGCANISDSTESMSGTSPMDATIITQSNPEVSDPPINPFQVLPSPRIRLPSFMVFPPSIGHGP